MQWYDIYVRIENAEGYVLIAVYLFIYLFITFAFKMRKVMFWAPCIYLFICMRVIRLT